MKQGYRMTKNEDKSPVLSIVVPVLNEEKNIDPLIQRIFGSLAVINAYYEIIFVDDNSQDNTVKIIKSYMDRYPITVYAKTGQKGKAQSLLEGFKHAKGSLICMIDADLQYPPEIIPKMIREIENGADIVVADRASHNETLMRKFTSRSFRFIFGKLLHGLDCDVQSGLKVFKKEIIERITIDPAPWTFDLEFLTKARAGGYKIKSVPITFEKRAAGETKVNIFSTSAQIGWEALKLKLKPSPVIPLHPDREKKVGKGFHFKGVEFVHHSDLPIHESAIHTFHTEQLFVLFGIACYIIAAFLYNWIYALITIFAFLTILYFIDLLFNLTLILRSFVKEPELIITPEEIKSIADKDWPSYTIFCPLYREWEVVPQFVKAISALDYPKNKLQVQLLLEEDDLETRHHVAAMKLPSYFEVIVVPHSLPKTKPKACNYGLRFATGDYAVIYDAEDMPDPLQLKKAVLAFKKSDEKTVCIQAKLNYYNPSQNLLTRLFTTEYSLWFDLILTGLQSLHAPIPLGGTSNHFKTDHLKDLKGWDSFNVTEDCDLGMRMVKHGFKTAIVDSTTMEEANSDFKNWLNQRTRWIKGYMQTYLVHMRRPSEFKNTRQEPHLLAFQIIVGGKILSMFINPFMWITTILYFTLRPIVGPTIEQLFPGPVLYMGVFCLIAGNFLYLYYYMIGCAKREQYDLIKYVFLVPLYWIAMSIAAWKAVYQLFRKPHFWPKTIHGLHLQKQKIPKTTFVKAPVPVQSLVPKKSAVPNLRFNPLLIPYYIGAPILWSIYFIARQFTKSLNIVKLLHQKLDENKTWNVQVLSSASILLSAMMLANLLNFLFNAYLGRVLDFDDFGLMTFLNTLLTVSGIFTSALSGTINHRTAYINSRFKDQSHTVFFQWVLKRSVIFIALFSILWIVLAPITAHFFRIVDPIPVMLFTPVITLGIFTAIGRGFLQGSFSFVTMGILIISEAVLKFVLAFILIQLHLNEYAYLPITSTILLSSLLYFFFVRKNIFSKASTEHSSIFRFPKRFFISNTVAGISSTMFLTLDVLLAKHYLTPKAAGEYAFLSLAGKMVFFFGSMLSTFIFPFIGRDEGARQDSNKTFNRLLLGTALMTTFIYIFVGPLGSFTLPILFGAKTTFILPFLNSYALAITLFTISNVYLNYHIARHNHYFSVLSIILSTFMGIGIVLSHENIQEIVEIILIVSVLRVLVFMLAHKFNDKLKFVWSNIEDFFGLFNIASKYESQQTVAKKILIFNWRDTRHKFAGGAEVYIHELAKRWVKAGHKVTVFCGNDGHSPRYETIDGVEVVRRGGFYFVYVWAFLYYVLKFRDKYDIVIDCENGIPFFTPLYVQKKKYLVIHHIHQDVFRKSLSPLLSMIATTLEMKIMPLVYRKIPVITVSPSSKHEIMNWKISKKEPVIIYNGVDLKRYKPAKKSEIPMVLYLGRLQQYKSLHVLIEAAKKILEHVPKAEFVIAGDGEDKHNLQALVKSLKLEAKITFLGKVTEEEKINLYQRAWVFVNPSFMEGWGITTIEANACGTPVVASRVSGLKDSVKNPHTGYLVDYGDVDAFADKIAKLLTNKTVRSSMSEEAENWAKKFDWNISANKSLEIING